MGLAKQRTKAVRFMRATTKLTNATAKAACRTLKVEEQFPKEKLTKPVKIASTFNIFMKNSPKFQFFLD